MNVLNESLWGPCEDSARKIVYVTTPAMGACDGSWSGCCQRCSDAGCCRRVLSLDEGFDVLYTGPWMGRRTHLYIRVKNKKVMNRQDKKKRWLGAQGYMCEKWLLRYVPVNCSRKRKSHVLLTSGLKYDQEDTKLPRPRGIAGKTTKTAGLCIAHVMSGALQCTVICTVVKG